MIVLFFVRVAERENARTALILTNETVLVIRGTERDTTGGREREATSREDE